jgi:hypothetical protein
MSGNVWEWYGGYSLVAQTDLMGASSVSDRVRRGGCWGTREETWGEASEAVRQEVFALID